VWSRFSKGKYKKVNLLLRAKNAHFEHPSTDMKVNKLQICLHMASRGITPFEIVARFGMVCCRPVTDRHRAGLVWLDCFHWLRYTAGHPFPPNLSWLLGDAWGFWEMPGAFGRCLGASCVSVLHVPWLGLENSQVCFV
jgi:hypothetical protein